MDFSKKLYQDKIAPSVPEWYANVKYQPGKTSRETYIENALNPYLYSKSYAFYNLRQSIKRKQLEEAAMLEKEHAKKVKDKQRSLSGAKWRKLVNYVF